MIDFFAVVVLVILLLSIIAAAGVLGALPGKIARDRKHPQSDAINVAGWIGLIFGGVLWPLALIWAFTNANHDTAKVTAVPARSAKS